MNMKCNSRFLAAKAKREVVGYLVLCLTTAIIIGFGEKGKMHT